MSYGGVVQSLLLHPGVGVYSLTLTLLKSLFLSFIFFPLTQLNLIFLILSKPLFTSLTQLTLLFYISFLSLYSLLFKISLLLSFFPT